MDRSPVASTNVSSVGYLEDSQTLEIEFHRGGIYQYFDVPPGVHRELVDSKSVGEYFSDYIKNTYRYARL